MAKPLGLTERNGVYQLRVYVPHDLLAAYGGRVDFRISLGRVSYAQAKSATHRLRAEKEAEFEASRAVALKRLDLKAIAAPHAPISSITPELAQAIAQGVYAADLAQDEAGRDSDEGRAVLVALAAFTNPSKALLLNPQAPPEFHYMDGIPDDAAEVLAALNAIREGDTAKALARRKLSTVLPQADAVARKMGLEVDWTTESAKQALRLSLEELRKAHRGRVQRDLGEVIPTPPAPVVAAPVASQAPTVSEGCRFELRHKTLMEKVRKELTSEGQQNFLPSSYTGDNGRTYPMFRLTKRGAELMVMSESSTVRHKVYDRMVALEGALKAATAPAPATVDLTNAASLRGLLLGYTEQVLALPKNYAEALRLAADNYEVAEAAKAQVVLIEAAKAQPRRWRSGRCPVVPCSPQGCGIRCTAGQQAHHRVPHGPPDSRGEVRYAVT